MPDARVAPTYTDVRHAFAKPYDRFSGLEYYASSALGYLSITAMFAYLAAQLF